LELAKDLGGRTAAATSEPRATFFTRQRGGSAGQRGGRQGNEGR